MDKLELDARVAKLEKRISLITVVLLLAAVGLVTQILITSVQREIIAATPVAMEVHTPPANHPHPVDQFQAASAHAGMMFRADVGNPHGEGTMASMQHELSSTKQLFDETIINEKEWLAKKSKILSKQLTPGELRSDLEMVEQLHANQVICEDERSDLRARLLGIEESCGKSCEK